MSKSKAQKNPKSYEKSYWKVILLCWFVPPLLFSIYRLVGGRGKYNHNPLFGDNFLWQTLIGRLSVVALIIGVIAGTALSIHYARKVKASTLRRVLLIVLAVLLPLSLWFGLYEFWPAPARI